jgi:hypothetical protein
MKHQRPQANKERGKENDTLAATHKKLHSIAAQCPGKSLTNNIATYIYIYKNQTKILIAGGTSPNRQ